MLFWQAAAQCGNVGVYTLRLLLGKLWEIVPVALQCVGDVVCGLRVAKLENGVVVEGPVLRLLVLAPELLALDAEDLHPDPPGCRRVVRHDLGRERGVTHDDVVHAWLLEHALSEMGG